MATPTLEALRVDVVPSYVIRHSGGEYCDGPGECSCASVWQERVADHVVYRVRDAGGNECVLKAAQAWALAELLQSIVDGNIGGRS